MLNKTTRRQFTNYAQEYYTAKEQEDTERTQEIVKEWGFDTLGGDCIGSGSGRVVFDLDICGHPDLCVKIAIPHPQWDGQQQNSREVSIWNTVSEIQRDYLVEVVESGPDNYWMVMKKGQSIDNLPYNWLQDAKYHLREIVWKKDISEDNIVKIDGKYKFCDYGVSPQ